MTTYYEKQVGAYQKQIADALSGKRLRDSIRQLQERSKIVSSLKPLQARGSLTAKKKIGKRVAGTQADFYETSRAFHGTTRTLTSTDGLFVIAWRNVSQIVTEQATFFYLDFDPNA